MSTYVVGDIQGCYQPLCALLAQVNFDPHIDYLWSVGDLVNRGPDSLAVLRFFKSLGNHGSSVLGNHDLHLLAVAAGVRPPNKKDTLADILSAPDRNELLAWLYQRPLIHVDTVFDAVLVHAGLPPQWSLSQAQQYAAEVETVLQSNNPNDFLSNMYGNEPDLWHNDLVGVTRLRVITNYLTRMRYLNERGALNLTNKQGLAGAKATDIPWFKHPLRKSIAPTIIFGHWASLDGLTDNPGIMGLDTGCVWGHQLTLLRLDDRQLFATPCQKS